MAILSPPHLHFRSCHSLHPKLSSYLPRQSAVGRPGLIHCVHEESVELPAGLRRELMPRHVAVIMDGNRRWARMKGVPVQLGYEAGFRALRRVTEFCCNWGIQVLTVFAFSSDNWTRPEVETDFLMKFMATALENETQELINAGIRVSIIGDTSSLKGLVNDAMETTANSSRLHLIVAVNYSGQNDVVKACQKLALKVKDGLLKPEDINKASVETELQTSCTEIPSPDLLIRTSGEMRISDFLLWQLAYTELHFVHSLWPDFSEDDFRDALFSFQKRERRMGK